MSDPARELLRQFVDLDDGDKPYWWTDEGQALIQAARAYLAAPPSHADLVARLREETGFRYAHSTLSKYHADLMNEAADALSHPIPEK